MKARIILTPFIPALLLLSGCVTHINTDVTQNPPPREPFSKFTRFELAPITLAPPYAGQDSNEHALKKIQENASEAMNPVLARWNSAGLRSPVVRTLVIEPRVTEIKFIGIGVRIWTGSFSGSSAVILRAKITEKETGEVIATPEFYAKAAATGGAFTLGVTDNLMLSRIADRLTDYLQANYGSAVGGPTGAEPPSK